MKWGIVFDVVFGITLSGFVWYMVGDMTGYGRGVSMALDRCAVFKETK